MVIYFNNSLVREEDAFISVFDHGLLYGVFAFETLRVYSKKPFLLSKHLKRLEEILTKLNISLKIAYDDFFSKISKLLKVNRLSNAIIRITVTAGKAPLNLQKKYTEPNLLIFIKALPSYLNNIFFKGKEIFLLNTRKFDYSCLTYYKTSNFLNSVLAYQETQTLAKEGIFLTKDGFLAEGIVSNLFFVINKVLYTPSLKLGIVKGITREMVFSLAQELGIEIREGFYKPDILEKADEIFITNSVIGIVPVYKYNNRDLKTVLSSRIYKKYQECILKNSFF